MWIFMIHTSGEKKYCQRNITKIAKSSTQKFAKDFRKVTLQNLIRLHYLQMLWIIMASWPSYATRLVFFTEYSVFCSLITKHYAVQCLPTKGKPCFKVRIVLYGLSRHSQQEDTWELHNYYMRVLYPNTSMWTKS